MNSRFRKSFPLMGKWLKWTVSKKGVSLNASLGPLSRSWGTRGNNTTVDAPGAFGLSWRKYTRRGSKSDAPSEEESAALAASASRRLWTRGAYAVIALEALVEAAHLWLHPFQEMERTGAPGLTLLVLVVLQVALVHLLRGLGLRGFGILFFTLVGAYVQWKLFGWLAWDSVQPVVEPPVPNPEPPAPSPSPSPAAD